MSRKLTKIVNDIDKLYNSNIHTIIKNATPNDKKYLAAIMNQQQGGNSQNMNNISLNELSLIASGNREIKQIVENLKLTTTNLINELELTKQENKILKEKIRNLDKGVAKLDKTNCKQLLKQAQQYIERFLEIRKAMITLVDFTKEKVLLNSNKLKFLSKPPLEYEDDLEMLKNIKIKSPSCENVEGILQELEEYQNPDILNRIIGDYENLSGTVRVIVRIFNESYVNPNKRRPIKTFDYTIIKDENKIKKIKQTIKSQCELPKEYTNINNETSCLTPGSIKKEDKYVIRTKYPCSESSEMIPFRYSYGPFYNVYENINNNTLFSEYKSIIENLKRGNQVITFGYGFSGSGKTYSLLGDNKELGLLQLTLNNIETDTERININIKELYGRIEPPTLVPNSSTNYINNIQSNIIQYGNSDKNNLNLFLNNIQTKRLNDKLIKYTSNNGESSRGHLLIDVDVKFKNGIETKFILIDLAGAEDPFIIGKTFLKVDPLALKSITKNDIRMLLTDITNPELKIRSTFWEKELLEDFAKKTKTDLSILPQENRNNKIKIKISDNDNKNINQIMNRLFLFYFKNELFGEKKFQELFNPFRLSDIIDYIWNMLTEGFFINESLNHLKIFLQRQADKKVNIIPASSNKKLSGIIHKTITANEMKVGADKTRYSPDKLLFNPDIDNKIQITKILENFTETGQRGTNFIMITTLRDELTPNYCNGTSNTLDFAQQIKST